MPVNVMSSPWKLHTAAYVYGWSASDACSLRPHFSGSLWRLSIVSVMIDDSSQSSSLMSGSAAMTVTHTSPAAAPSAPTSGSHVSPMPADCISGSSERVAEPRLSPPSRMLTASGVARMLAQVASSALTSAILLHSYVGSDDSATSSEVTGSAPRRVSEAEDVTGSAKRTLPWRARSGCRRSGVW